MNSLIRPFKRILDPDVKRLERELVSPIVVEPVVEPVIAPSSIPTDYFSVSNYEIIEGQPYSDCLDKLRKKYTSNPNIYSNHPTFEGLPRPLTLLESLEMRLQHPELLDNYLDSCTGLAYKANTSKMKIIPICKELCTLTNFSGDFLSIPYDSLQGVELDLSQGIYGKLLSSDEIIVHPFWLAVFNNDVSKLRAYRDLVFTKKFGSVNASSKAMGINVRTNVTQDELRALCVHSIDVNSDADGYYNLNDYVRFLLKLPPSSSQTFLGGKQ